MTAFSFAHVADLHLDTPFSGLASVNEDLAARLQDASLDAWDRVVQECLERQVTFLVIAGDIYDSDTASVRAQLRFRKGLERLSQANIQSFIVHGNHDPKGGRWSAIKSWPVGVTIFGTQDVTHVQVVVAGETLATVSGISYPERHVQENLARRFQRSDHPSYHVAVLHCNVGGDAAHGVYAPCSLDDLRESRYDYWALGHIHARRVLHQDAPLVVYPGNTQARHPNETGEKGFAVVHVTTGPARIEWVETDSWRFEQLECPVDDLTSVGELEELLCAHAAVRGHNRPVVLRARLSGTGPLHSVFYQTGARGSLLQALRDQASPDVWWDDVLVQTRAPFDRRACLEGGDFVADFLRQVDRAEPRAVVAALLQELRSNTALGGVQHLLGLDELLNDASALLAEAELLALSHLEGR